MQWQGWQQRTPAKKEKEEEEEEEEKQCCPTNSLNQSEKRFSASNPSIKQVTCIKNKNTEKQMFNISSAGASSLLELIFRGKKQRKYTAGFNFLFYFTTSYSFIY